MSDSNSTKSNPVLPKIDFSTFVNSLAASALMHLGIMSAPMSQTKTKDLPMAKQSIDILAMLEEKTKNNLTADEKDLMTSLLHDLRLKYVAELK